MRFRCTLIVALAGLLLVVAGPAAARRQQAARAPAPAASPASVSAPTSSPAPSAVLLPPQQQVVAVVDGQPISLADLDLMVAADMALLRVHEHDLRSMALENLVNGLLLDREARERSLDARGLMAAEVDSQLKEPTAEDLDQLWKATPSLAASGRSFDEYRPAMIAELKRRQAELLQEALAQRLRTKHAAAVELKLQGPRVEVGTNGSPSRGPDDAPVTVVAFSDFQCPGCARADASLTELAQRQPTLLRIVHRDFPTTHHPDARRAAEAARCAGDQDGFWPFHDMLFADFTRSTPAGLVDTARDTGLDVEAFEACLASGKHAADVDRDLAEGQRLGITGTPQLYVNGLPLPGVSDPDALARVVSSELNRARQRK